MKVAVGSQNKPKLEAVTSAFALVWPQQQWEVVGVQVDSGVPDQPKHQSETILGAKNRAQRALEQTGADYGVGLEGGVHQIEDKWFESSWMVIRRADGVEGIGSTIHMELPKVVSDKILEGIELGDIIDDIFEGQDLRHKEGFFGKMTDNHITRASGYRDGVIAAATQFIQEDLYA